jgi:hypothetical protein|tara:strand:+ start:817 stop:960 length:144 start_codon:yes stop_codon:yes gene_type:complete
MNGQNMSDPRDVVRATLKQELHIWKRWWWSWVAIFGIWFIGIFLGNV